MKVLLSWLREFAPDIDGDPVALGEILSGLGLAVEEMTITGEGLDGIVLARSVFNSSMNYRSVTVFGTPELVEGHENKLAAMRIISEHSIPGRWDEVRDSHDREVKMTGVIRLSIDSASAKVSTGNPDDEDADYDSPVWAGVLPVKTTVGEILDDDRLLPGVAASDAVRALQNRII